ncbi:MAG: CPBP family intramembrane metalloprotease [Myxococcales bacterium]|nr:CPBP family intramembrane metalloprotease [Myxococcales bacterium]MBL0195717.1 CPBP family intramembrane metalloprotease [Myxococcales bacterium]HQY61917.1 CPBP family intramembrane metalloprotease [Polyangiaceae bacterium]
MSANDAEDGGLPQPPEHAARDVVYVREPGGTASRVPIAALTHGDRPAPVRVSAHTEVAISARGPFEPLAFAVARDAAMRSRLAAGLNLPIVGAYSRLRPFFYVGLVPLLMLAELDREMLHGYHGARVRLALGLAFAVGMAVDFARRVPRHAGASAAVLLWVAARYAHILAVTCGRTENAAVGVFAPALAVGVALTLLARAPSGNRLTEAILDRLGVDPSEVVRVRLGEPPSRALVATSVGAAVALPLLLAAMNRAGAGLWTTGLTLVLYGAVVPDLVTRLLERPASPAPPAPPTPRARFGRIALAATVGFALTYGLVSGAHRSFDAGIYLQRCTHPDAFEREGRRLLEAETREVERGVARAKDRLPILLMTVLAVPLAEERLYRGLLQRVLTRRYGERRGLVAASLLFGAAHLAVYRVASYQAALLGFGFGTAWVGGGLPASLLAHAVWNAHLLL